MLGVGEFGTMDDWKTGVLLAKGPAAQGRTEGVLERQPTRQDERGCSGRLRRVGRSMKRWGILGGVLGLAACQGAPKGPDPGSGFNKERQQMVQTQLRGPGRGIKNERVLAAMGSVERHEFVPPAQRVFAYQDRPLPIGHGQTISQPYIVAFMTEILDPQPSDRILEIGTGSGYQAAVLAKLVKRVYSVEIVKPLAVRAEATLKRLGYENVTVRAGDGYKGWKEHAPYDSVIVTCAPEHGSATPGRATRGGRKDDHPGGRAGRKAVAVSPAQGARRHQEGGGSSGPIRTAHEGGVNGLPWGPASAWGRSIDRGARFF